ncbi:MAG TPA: hypothetical protein VFG04_22290 [Planctomycetaceae bacterium]|jgi:hypothetical protein|nr:hypothetical protein [Planctomycetaceae bacterium]
MRRTVLLGVVVPVLALGFVACAQAVLLAQSPKTPAPIGPQAPEPIRAAAPLGPAAQDVPTFGAAAPRTSEAASPALEALPIRQRFIELSRKKAYALNEEQLKREVEAMEAEVRELEAWAKAQEAVRLLHEVIEKHPNTKAAETANAAIQLIEQGRNPLIDQRRGVPVFPSPKPFRGREEAPRAVPSTFDGNTSS